MKFLKKMKIGQKINLAFGIVFILFIIFGFSTLKEIDNLIKVSEDMYNHPYMVSNTVREININILAMHRSMKDITFGKNHFQIEKFRDEVRVREREVLKLYGIVFEKFLGNHDEVEAAHSFFKEWKPIRDEVISLCFAGKNAEAILITQHKGREHVEKILKKNGDLIKFADLKVVNFYHNAQQKARMHFRQLMFMVLISLLIVIIVSYFISQGIRKRLSKMIQVADSIEKGDLSKRNEITVYDEIGDLAESFNKMIDFLENKLYVQKSVALVSKELLSADKVISFSRKIIEIFSQNSNADIIAFYKLDKKTDTLLLLDSIGANAKIRKNLDIHNLEGNFEFAVTSKRIYQLIDIPEDSIFTYSTIAGDVKAKDIITIPIMHLDNVIALIVLASVKNFSKSDLEIIDNIWLNLNSAFARILADEKTRELSQELQKNNEKLQSQSEELQAQAEELKSKSEELKEQNYELEQQRREVAEANQLKSEFLSNMSHELRTPLNSILALSRVLMAQTKSILSEKQAGYLEIVERNGRNLLRMINEILDLSKIEAGKMDVFLKEFSLPFVINEIVENLKPLAESKSLTLTCQILPDINSIESDEIKLHQVFTNVINNAIKFTQTGEVKILCEKQNNKIAVIVEDTGIGISPESLPNIFDEFRQADGTSSRHFEGTGLGLSIAYKLMQILGGDIKVESELNVGTKFTIIIPVKNENLIDTVKILNDPAEHEDKKDFPSQHLLIIDDNPVTITQVESILLNEGYSVDIAASGKEALQMIKNKIPDGIILDLMMPEMDGFEVLEKVRSKPQTKRIPVLVLTAKSLTKEDFSKLSSNNVQQLVQKGDINKQGFLRRVKQMLQNGTEKNDILANNDQDKKRILIVEDNPDNMTTIKAVLGDRFEIYAALDGESGLRQAVTKLPDLILLDMTLPKMDGTEIVGILKQSDDTKNIKIIAVTARVMPEDKAYFLKEGCDGFVPKPIDESVLLKEIEKWI